jgi:cytochrome o ubiquinol oxidase subunit 2
MSGMAMKLNLIADEPGSYLGMGANFSGRDFGKMQFTAKASSQEEFDKWVDNIRKTSPALTTEGYNELAVPGLSDKVTFSSIPKGLFHQIVTKYGGHEHGYPTSETTTHEHHMNHK